MNTRIIDGVEYEIVWDGGQLLPPRLTKTSTIWQAPASAEEPKRAYNKRSEHWNKPSPRSNMRIK